MTELGYAQIQSAKTGISVGYVDDSTSGSVEVGSEVRPINMHVHYIIRIY